MKLSKISAAILLAALSNPQAVFATEIGNIVVTANNAKQNLASVTAKTEVITEQDIEEKQFQTLKDALQTVPGINLYNSGGPFLGTQIQIRGSSNSQVLIMVDGISINDPIGFGANLDNISLQDIAQIEIIKSPQAGIWGANAAAGVINIITKSGQNSQQGNFSVEKGSFNSIKIASTLTAKSEQADFSLSISHKSSNGYSSIILKDDDVNKNESDGYSQTDIGFNTGFNLTKDHRIELLFKDTNTESDYDAYGFPSDPNDVNSNVTLSSQLKKLQYVFQNDQLKARAYLSRYEIDRISSEPFVTGTYNGSNSEMGASLNFEYMPNQNLSTGLTNSKVKGKSDYYSISEAEYQTSGAFISNTNQFRNGRLIITESIRSDQFDNDFKDKITGKIGLKNYFTSDVYIGGQFGTAYNAPSIYAYANALDKLQPESIEGYELNIGAYGFEASFYNNEVANLIDYTSGWPSYAYNLDGTSELKGYELSYAKYLSLISSYVSLSFEELSAKNSEQQWLGRRPENQAKLDINYDGFKNTVIGVQSRYIGKMYDQNNQQGQQIGEYWLTDVNVNYNLNKDFTLYGRINNILDESYIPAVANYDSSTGLATHVYNSAGRQFFIGLRGKL